MSHSSTSQSKKGWPEFRWPLLLLGTLLLLIGFFWQSFPSQDLSFSVPPEFPDPKTSPVEVSWSFPTRIRIPSIDVDLPVIPSRVVGDNWQTTSKGVSFLTSSSLIGQPGNSIFYGHNWTSLLGRLNRVQIGDTISVDSTPSGRSVFVIEDVKIVDPTDTTILLLYPEPKLTLYTCTGLLDSKRLVVIASPASSDSKLKNP